ncbi:MAG: mannose-1-phosphate guanylyltransferase/mannose-6-phosphate isomerase [Arcobacter sp.]|nr:MAG: mannose-1-phosphate guanylyltransferase/mannose-6-phosphate isomerase [Arcobacter sp.]
MTNLILCGGNGTRLWPISRTLMPKQFVKLFKDKSLFQLTVKRNAHFCENQYIVSNAEQYFLAMDQLESKEKTTFLLEPIGRNTAPAIALACLGLDKEEIVLVSPSDHLIKNEVAYKEVVLKAKEEAENNKLVTFGIKPLFAETGYGYIEAEGNDVKSFKEKPDLQTATQYLEAGNYYWNSGMFCFKAGVFLNELKKYSPKIYDTCLTAYTNANKDDLIRIAHEDMENISEDSIDYAVMEKSDIVKVIASDIDWSDLGSFDALYEELPQDKNGNTQEDKHISINSKNNLILTTKNIATIDVEDLIIVDTVDALLISKKGSSQKVKEVVKQLKEKGSHLPQIHTTAHRPWGTYTILDECEKYKIKRIVVNPGKRLSLQKHFHRSEHWIVVSGTATVTRGEEEFLVRANESTYIPMGEIHRLENVGKIPLVMIEAQVGEYLGEDDIVRISDDFKRV